MPKPVIFHPRSLPEYLGLVEKLQRRAGYSLWYRGTGESSYPLIPTLYRHPTEKTTGELSKLERQLMTRFRQRSIPYHSRDLKDDWENIFFMQHYGVPTRLLDWTENPLTGLHFALMSGHYKMTKKRKPIYTKPCVVWILDPHIWNKSALSHISYREGPLTPGDKALNGYTPPSASGMTEMGQYPVALYGAHNSSRIVAQQGVFVIFGVERMGMEELVKAAPFSGVELIKVMIHPTWISSMRKSLLNNGITESVVFPDLEGLARETKRHFGFEV